MSPETVIYKLQRAIESQLNSLTIVITTGVDSMEKYRYILGQINALESVRQELSSLLNSEEKNEGTVIDIGDHKLKDNATK
jgi:bisphosphoglycerate-independent phosphoglycerate mutase (AlkP superfamily)